MVRGLIPFIIILLSLAGGIYGLTTHFSMSNEFVRFWLYGGLGVIVVMATVRMMAGYLERDPNPRMNMPMEFGLLRSELEAELVRFRERAAGLASADQQQIVAQLQEEIKTSATKGFLEEIRASVAKQDRAKEWEGYFDETMTRIVTEIGAQGRRGNLNLMLGIVTALTGIALLGWFVVRDATAHTSLNDFLISFIPRISIVAIIEVFSYFFLRLYKVSLSEIKYFQNEATNLELRFAGLRIALEANEPALRKEVVKQLLATERNPLLTKGTTTLELERERLDLTATTISLPHALAMVKEALAHKDKKDGEDKHQ